MREKDSVHTFKRQLKNLYSLAVLADSRRITPFLFPEWSRLLGLLPLKYRILSMSNATGFQDVLVLTTVVSYSDSDSILISLLLVMYSTANGSPHTRAI